MDNLWTTRRGNADKPVDNFMCLTPLLPSSSASERVYAGSSLRRLAVVGALCLVAGLLILQATPAQAKNVDYLKLYAHSKVVDFKEYKCLSKIIYKESRWSITAINGSHYGLGQMSSKHYRNLDGEGQIDATVKYINKRYGSMCAAWAFHGKKGYY